MQPPNTNEWVAWLFYPSVSIEKNNLNKIRCFSCCDSANLQLDLATFSQNSKPKGANFDILHFGHFLANLSPAFRSLKVMEFHHSLHQTTSLYILWCKRILGSNWMVRFLQTYIFWTEIRSKCLNFWKLRLAPLCHRITLIEHKKYALRVINY